jgi:clan AA aspartic protease (TIGR02281 family)
MAQARAKLEKEAAVRGVALAPPATTAAKSADGLIRVEMIQANGIYTVPVQINGQLTLNFALDSGASAVSIPSDVFGTLVRTGTLAKTDIIGRTKYRLADGSIKEAPTFQIRSLKVGTVTLENVSALVAEASGPLLLGMSFLARFTSWSVDNARHQLVLVR